MLQRICQPESTTILNNTLDDANALIELLDKMQPYIWKSLNHFSIHPNDKEYLQQEILFKVFKALSQFDFSKETPLAHYVNRIIKNTKNHYIRKKLINLKRQKLLENEFLITEQMLRQQHTIDGIVLRKEIVSTLYQNIDKLTELEQTIIRYVLKDYKPCEIATILCVDVKVVYNTIHRCKIKLRHFLK